MKYLNPIALTGIGVVSKFGLDKKSFFNEKSETSSNNSENLIAEFDIKELLGRKNNRYLDKATAMAILALNEALSEVDISTINSNAGVIIGTNTGSLKSTIDFTIDTYTQERPYLVNPACFPQTILNFTASNIALRNGFKGVNSTIASGHLTGFSIFNYVSNLIDNNFEEMLVVGTTEEVNDYTTEIFKAKESYVRASSLTQGEGAVVFIAESKNNALSNGREIFAEVVGSSVLNIPNCSSSDSLAINIDTLLKDCNVSHNEIGLCCIQNKELSIDNSIELKAINSIIPRENREIISLCEQLGDCYCTSNFMQVLMILKMVTSKAKNKKTYCIATAINDSGLTGCSLLKI